MAETTAEAWALIEADYRAGIKSLRQIAGEHGITEGAVRKRAKKDEWERDLGAKIQARAELLVRKEAVRTEVRSAYQIPERDIIEANAEVQAVAQITQRRDTARAIETVQKLFAGLDGQIDLRDDLEQLGELMRSDEDTDRLNDIYRKVIAFPSNVDAAKKLMEALRIGVELQRKVLRIRDEDQMPTDGIAALLRGMSRSAIKPSQMTDDDD